VRAAIVSDVHGNIRGLDACLADLAEQGGADIIIGAGDYCMDGPRPREVLERLQEIGARCVRGNTDRYIAGEDEAEPIAAANGGIVPGDSKAERIAGDFKAGQIAAADDIEAEAFAWQREQLGASWLERLRAFPFSLRIGSEGNELLVVHANPRNDEEHIWPDADDGFLVRMTSGVPERTIAFGHLHLPYVRAWRDHIFVNVASAGLPKDGDPRACYAIVTERAGGWEIKHRRVAFDIERVARQIRKSGMPDAKARERVLLRHRYKELGERIP
jgi:predicted phosphodiesterase